MEVVCVLCLMDALTDLVYVHTHSFIAPDDRTVFIEALLQALFTNDDNDARTKSTYFIKVYDDG